MSITIDLDKMPDSIVTSNRDVLQEYLTNAILGADYGKGTVNYDLVIRPYALLHTMTEINVGWLQRSGSLLDISRSPELTDDDLVDSVLSNFRVVRSGGKTAVGQVNILISSNALTAIPSNSIFVAGTLSFFTQQPFVGVTDQSLIASDTDRLIRQVADGVYSFAVDVVAEKEGSEYQLNQGDVLVLQTPPSNYISSNAAYDFATGLGQETTRELIDRLDEGLANRTPGNRTNVSALVRESYPDIINTSVVGLGQPEMHRDQINLFRISYGGKSDNYIQTAPRPTVTRVTKSAVLVNKATGTWQMFFNRDEFAGVYKIEAVTSIDAQNDIGSLAISSEVRGIDSSPATNAPDAYIPDIEAYYQASFSRYQTDVIEFLDPNGTTDDMTEIVTTKDYYVDLLSLPDIAGIQDDVFSNHWVTNHRYDDLVRAPIPCLVSISFGIRVRAGETFNMDAMKSAIADRINQLGFRNRLSSSYIIDAAHGMLGEQSSIITPIDMLGEVVSPVDGSTLVYRSATELLIQEDMSISLSKRTMTFFCSPTDIDVYTEVAT